MRKEAKQAKSVQMAQITGYHAGGYQGNYAYQGFRVRKYFVSDRFELLDENFNRENGEPLKGYGLEIETECKGVRNADVYAEVLDKIIFAQFKADLFKMQRDSSLGGDVSAECITQVMTKSAVRNMYPAFKLMYDTYFPAFRISCSESGNCGMHVNISKALFGESQAAQDMAIRKLLYFVNHHYKFACQLFARNPGHTTFCQRMPEYDNQTTCKTVNLSTFYSDHGKCFNLGHYDEGRVELRLVGGQSSYGCFRNTMESVFFLVDAVKRLSWDSMDKLEKIFTGCNQYVFDRIKTKCYQAGTITLEQVAAINAKVKHEQLL